jgi:hypothetical protein
MIYLFDLDGTLCDIPHRLHFIKKESGTSSKDWDAFFAACTDDSPIPEVIAVARALGAFADIIIMSGRSDSVRQQTLDWLSAERVPIQGLYMREVGDHREDSIVKGEFLDDLLTKTAMSEIAGVFEDRSQVVKMYRVRGLRVFQVADGDF